MMDAVYNVVPYNYVVQIEKDLYSKFKLVLNEKKNKIRRLMQQLSSQSTATEETVVENEDEKSPTSPPPPTDPAVTTTTTTSSSETSIAIMCLVYYRFTARITLIIVAYCY